LNEEGLFGPEYADVLGIPFDFTAKPVVAPPTKPPKTVRIEAVRPDRDALQITFPRVEGYRVELPEERLTAKFTADSVLELTPELVGPTDTTNRAISPLRISAICGRRQSCSISPDASCSPNSVIPAMTPSFTFSIS
jgi:hypothetical protein